VKRTNSAFEKEAGSSLAGELKAKSACSSTKSQGKQERVREVTDGNQKNCAQEICKVEGI